MQNSAPHYLMALPALNALHAKGGRVKAERQLPQHMRGQLSAQANDKYRNTLGPRGAC